MTECLDQETHCSDVEEDGRVVAEVDNVTTGRIPARDHEVNPRVVCRCGLGSLREGGLNRACPGPAKVEAGDVGEDV